MRAGAQAAFFTAETAETAENPPVSWFGEKSPYKESLRSLP
jgi:hypothetical protein